MRQAAGWALATAALLAGGAAAGVARAGPAANATRPFAPLALDGHVWAAMTEGEKLRYLEGFLAGQALSQATAAKTSADQLRRDGSLAYPFAPSVYKTRLEDFFFYRDRRDLPLHEAVTVVNEQLRRGGR